MVETMKIGISSCLLGNKVRFDGGHKRSQFCTDILSEYADYHPVCPEMAIGLGSPRPTIRLVEKDDVILVTRPNEEDGYGQNMTSYANSLEEKVKSLTGFIFCAKSPSCGMERVKVYDENGVTIRHDGIGAFARRVMEMNPNLPCEENGRLNDAQIRENFITRLFVYQKWQVLASEEITKAKLYDFHSQHKYLVMSHDVEGYRQLGRLLGESEKSPEQLAEEYIAGLMKALKKIATRKKHVNTLQHLQGYFSKLLSKEEKEELTQQVHDYRKGLVPFMVPLALLNHYLKKYPNAYLEKQAYFSPHPAALRLRVNF
ncbi:YbgA family protein [Thalassotalea agarivorans]|uniref:Uncharacterized conserved protein YbgA, DUF1722 family n=1 Tax=Thalassotalea agarivorans TaxID=349064 RepID=A0A1H9Y4I4_THASX|nr:DUF523 and DUF1722 domain-containing protein [Thalassotalea agarivorans]SES63748.1 Uncharacterized conserved protein YbgA, DUF1722 family [Thalassotalea agarivorans]